MIMMMMMIIIIIIIIRHLHGCLETVHQSLHIAVTTEIRTGRPSVTSTVGVYVYRSEYSAFEESSSLIAVC
jgi:hypothetical protein